MRRMKDLTEQTKKIKILITGSEGFIGRNLINYFDLKSNS